jgi:hypothetical protein
VSSGGRVVGIVGTPEDMKVLIRRDGDEEGEERSGMGDRLGKTVKEVGGCVQCLSPVAGVKRILEKEATQHVGGGANHALGAAILRGVVRARHPQLHAVGEKEGAIRGVIKLLSIIALNNLDGAVELSQQRKEVRNIGEGFRLRIGDVQRLQWMKSKG